MGRPARAVLHLLVVLAALTLVRACGSCPPTFLITSTALTQYKVNDVVNGPLTVYRGCAVTFDITGVGALHPFNIVTATYSAPDTFSAGNRYADVTNQGNTGAAGNPVLTVSATTPATLFYQCSTHPSMKGTITVADCPSASASASPSPTAAASSGLSTGCTAYCERMAANCPSAAYSIDCTTDCTAAFDKPGALGFVGDETGDSLSCRIRAADLAATDAGLHCPQAAIAATAPCTGEPPTRAPTCAEYCARAAAFCPTEVTFSADCETDCATIASKGTTTDATGNTLGCRLYHLSLGMAAVNPTTHCPHSQIFPTSVCVNAGEQTMSLDSSYRVTWSVRDNAFLDVALSIETDLTPSSVPAASATVTRADGSGCCFKGFMGIGFGSTTMPGADAYVAFIDKTTHAFTVVDLKAIERARPPADIDQPGGSDDVEPGSVHGRIEDGRLTIEFSRALKTDDPFDNEILLTGAQATVFSYNPTALSLEYHGASRRFALKVDWLTGATLCLASAVDDVLRFHGISMFLVWGVLYPIGIFVARFCKHSLDWLKIHRTLQSSGGLSSIVAILMALTAVGREFHYTHHILGFVVMGGLVAELLLGLYSTYLLRLLGKSKFVLYAHVILGSCMLLVSPYEMWLGLQLYEERTGTHSTLVEYLFLGHYLVMGLLFIWFEYRRIYNLRRAQDKRSMLIKVAHARQMHSYSWTDIMSAVEEGQLWTVVDDVVVDVRSWIHMHPGGQRLIRLAVGQDITPWFHGLRSYQTLSDPSSASEAGKGPVHRHSTFAMERLLRSVVGRVVNSSKRPSSDGGGEGVASPQSTDALRRIKRASVPSDPLAQAIDGVPDSGDDDANAFMHRNVFRLFRLRRRYVYDRPSEASIAWAAADDGVILSDGGESRGVCGVFARVLGAVKDQIVSAVRALFEPVYYNEEDAAEAESLRLRRQASASDMEAGVVALDGRDKAVTPHIVVVELIPVAPDGKTIDCQALDFEPGQHTSILIDTMSSEARASGAVHINRSYTPIVATRGDHGPARIFLVVRVYDGGAASRALETLPIDTVMKLRGPMGTSVLSSHHYLGLWPVALMVAAGSGVTPFLALIDWYFVQCARMQREQEAAKDNKASDEPVFVEPTTKECGGGALNHLWFKDGASLVESASPKSEPAKKKPYQLYLVLIATHEENLLFRRQIDARACRSRHSALVDLHVLHVLTRQDGAGQPPASSFQRGAAEGGRRQSSGGRARVSPIVPDVDDTAHAPDCGPDIEREGHLHRCCKGRVTLSTNGRLNAGHFDDFFPCRVAAADAAATKTVLNQGSNKTKKSRTRVMEHDAFVSVCGPPDFCDATRLLLESDVQVPPACVYVFDQ